METGTRPQFVYVTFIGAPPERVWDALTQSEFTRQYWGGGVIESEWKVGSKITVKAEGTRMDVAGEILQCEKPKLLSYTWKTATTGNEPPSRVTFELQGMGWATRLTLTHDQFPEGSKSLEAISSGWPGILANMKTLLETGKPLISSWSERPAPPK